MKGDFSTGGVTPELEIYFDGYQQVLFQQGRVFRDSDINEQSLLFLRSLRAVTGDIVGVQGGPAAQLSFLVREIPDRKDFNILRARVSDKVNDSAKAASVTDKLRIIPPKQPAPPALPDPPYLAYGQPGRYYVDGILCEQRHDFTYQKQPDYPGATLPSTTGYYLAYLDVWDRYVSSIEHQIERDADLSPGSKGIGLDFAEVGLGLAGDTCGRSKVVAQVRLCPLDSALIDGAGNKRTTFKGVDWQARLKLDEENAHFLPPASERGKMQATIQDDPKADPCLSRDGIGYSGPENQLYRVEVYGKDEDKLQILWSRENGSVLFEAGSTSNGNVWSEPGLEITVTVPELSQSSPFQLPCNSVVELLTPKANRRGDRGPLYIVTSNGETPGTVTLRRAAEKIIPADSITLTEALPSKFLLRRWDNIADTDQLTATLLAERGEPKDLEYNLKVTFDTLNNYPGDYWQIPARPEIAGILWPESPGLPPRGVEHHYAPLAILKIEGDSVTHVADLELIFTGLAQ